MASASIRTWAQPPAPANTANPLAVACARYPILETLVSHLVPDDVVTLTQVSQALHGSIRMHDAHSKANILAKTVCPGIGVGARMDMHCPCPVRKTFRASVGCTRVGYHCDSRPCDECGLNTCDECRIHVFYNCFTEDPGLDQHRWWAGYFFLHPAAVAVYPPKNADNQVWRLPKGYMKPLHDQGRFHIPLDIPAVGDPEPIDRILDINLGRRHHINPLGRTEFPYDGQHMVSFLNMVVARRKWLVCEPCYKQHQKQGHSQCSCTLRKRFLDRWVCIPCYFEEEKADLVMRCRSVVDDDSAHGHHHVCGACEADFPDDSEPKVLCNWCKGEIIIDEDETDDETHFDDKDDEEDEEHSAADYASLGPDEFGFAKNRDGSFSVYINGNCVRGERLGRAVVRQAMVEHDMPVRCTCCTCHGQELHHEPHQEPHQEQTNNSDMNHGVGDEDDGDWEDLPDLVETNGAEDEEESIEVDDKEEPDLLDSEEDDML